MVKDTKQVSTHIPKDLHQQVRVKSVKTGKSLAEVIREALKEWVSKDDPPKKDD